MPTPSSLQTERISRSTPREARVLDLQIRDLPYRGGAPESVGADLGQSDVPDVTGVDEFADCADGFDRDPRIQACGPVDVDVIGAQPLQRIGCGGLHRRRTSVEAEPCAVRAELPAELDAQLVGVAGIDRSASPSTSSLWPMP